jgi:hypothetical protein
MRDLFARYGGHGFIIGKGRASALNLPEDQSLDNMLDHHSVEIIPNLHYISSYTLRPEFMGAMPELPKGMVKLGTATHDFTDAFVQYDHTVRSDVFVGIHEYLNVFAVIIHTYEEDIANIYCCRKSQVAKAYDYVLTFHPKGQSETNCDLIEHPEYVEMLLITLFFTMGLNGLNIEFSPSARKVGKAISSEFLKTLQATLSTLKDENDLKELMLVYAEKYAFNLVKEPK